MLHDADYQHFIRTQGFLEKAPTPEGKERTPAPRMFLTKLNVAVDTVDPLFPSPFTSLALDGLRGMDKKERGSHGGGDDVLKEKGPSYMIYELTEWGLGRC